MEGTGPGSTMAELQEVKFKKVGRTTKIPHSLKIIIHMKTSKVPACAITLLLGSWEVHFHWAHDPSNYVT